MGESWGGDGPSRERGQGATTPVFDCADGPSGGNTAAGVVACPPFDDARRLAADGWADAPLNRAAPGRSPQANGEG